MWKWEAETDDFGMWKMRVDKSRKKKKKEQKENAKWNCLIINEIWSAEEKNCVSSSHLVVSLSLHRLHPIPVQTWYVTEMWGREGMGGEKHYSEIFKRNTVEKNYEWNEASIKEKGRIKKVRDT